MVSHQWRHVLSPDGQLTAFESGPDVEMTNLAAGGYLFALTVESDNAVLFPDFWLWLWAQYTAQDLHPDYGSDSGKAWRSAYFTFDSQRNGNWHVINSPENETTPTPEELGSGATSIRLTFQARGRYVIGVTAASGLSGRHAAGGFMMQILSALLLPHQWLLPRRTVSIQRRPQPAPAPASAAPAQPQLSPKIEPELNSPANVFQTASAAAVQRHGSGNRRWYRLAHTTYDL